MKLSIHIPVYNEEKTISNIVGALQKTSFSSKKVKIENEVIIADDCSRDNTRLSLQKEVESKADKVIYHEKNKGKSAAIRTSIKHMTGYFMVVQDADMEYDPKEDSKLIGPIIKGSADVAYGTRFSDNDALRFLYFWYFKENRFVTTLSNMFSYLNLTVVETCYKIFKRKIIQSIRLELNRFGFEPEVTAKIARVPDIQFPKQELHTTNERTGKEKNQLEGGIFSYQAHSKE